MAKKPPTKGSRKRKKDLFKGNKEILRVNSEISKLSLEKEKIQTDLKNLIDNFNSKLSMEDAEDFLERLPLESIKDLQEFEAGEKDNFVMNILREKSDLIREQKNKAAEIVSIDKKISEQEIDLLLAKINCVNFYLDQQDSKI